MNNKLIFAALLLISVTIFCVSSCKKDIVNEPLEPISLVSPDTSTLRLFPGDSTAIEIKFTTDRPINWIKGLYDLDTINGGTHITTYPDTLFFQKLDTLSPRVNLYTYKGIYFVPDSLDPYDIVRFKVSFEAGKVGFTTGQNYPSGKVSFSKEFKVNIR